MLYDFHKKTNYDELLYLVSSKCDRKCYFCFNVIFGEKIDTTIEENKNINCAVDFIRNAGIKKVYLSGGEPAIRNDILTIIFELTKIANVVIFTNGLLLNRFSVESIAEQQLSAINITLFKDDILNNTKYFQNLLFNVNRLRNINNKIQLNAQVMLDGDYFRIKKSSGLRSANAYFDRILWQPLSLDSGMTEYSNTLEGMDKKVVDEIISDLKSSSDREYHDYIDIMQMYFNKEKMPQCRMGYNYLVLDPNMQTIRYCPHLSLPKFTINKALQSPLGKHTSNCFSMRCVRLYSHLLRKYKD
jgi:organic radical activating enzyme